MKQPRFKLRDTVYTLGDKRIIESTVYGIRTKLVINRGDDSEENPELFTCLYELKDESGLTFDKNVEEEEVFKTAKELSQHMMKAFN